MRISYMRRMIEHDLEKKKKYVLFSAIEIDYLLYYISSRLHGYDVISACDNVGRVLTFNKYV